MADPVMLSRSETRPGQSLDAGGFRALQQLTRRGYAPDAETAIAGDALLMRHPNAPDLLLYPDGSIEIPASQSPQDAPPKAAPKSRRKRRWGRMLLILMGVTAYTMLAFLVLVIISEA